jgi:hypothetical protein
MGVTFRVSNFKNLSIFSGFWTPGWNLLQNSRFLPFLGGICMGGTLRMTNFKILSFFLISIPQYSYQKCHQI